MEGIESHMLPLIPIISLPCRPPRWYLTTSTTILRHVDGLQQRYGLEKHGSEEERVDDQPMPLEPVKLSVMQGLGPEGTGGEP
jgi:hypothetical protein